MGLLPNLNNAVPLIGWTLAHFIWQAAAIYLVFKVLCVFTARREPQIRYLIGCFALTAMLLSAVITSLLISRAPLLASGAPANALTSNTAATSTRSDEFITDVRGRIRLPHQITPSIYDRAAEVLAPWIPTVVEAWIAGLIVMSVLQIRGLFSVKRLVATSQIISPRPRYLQLAEKMGLNCFIQYAESACITSPATLGFLRPVILLPLAITCDFSAAELDAFVAHELAHIKRYDYLVNLCQVIIETLFFFHPCVWLVSSAMREERELCCDRLATRINAGNTKLYAHALVRLADKMSGRSFAMNASGGSLLNRITALANPGLASSPLSLASMIIVLAISLSIGSVGIGAITERAAKLHERTVMAQTPENVFIFDLLKARADNPQLKAALADALTTVTTTSSVDDPRLLRLATVLDQGGDPEVIWREYQRLEKPGYNPILFSEFPPSWQYNSAGMQRGLAYLLWNGALTATSPEDAHRRAKAALLVAAIHREESGMPAIASIVENTKFSTNSGFSAADVNALRRYASLRMDELSRQEISLRTASQ